jgi:cytoskeleton protein RodZ
MDVDKQQNKKKSKRTVIDIGVLLVEARENKNLSAQDIATSLNLTLSVITDIEANQFKQDIPLPFIRGYLRSYAKKVNADVETLSVEFDRQTKTADEPIQKLQVVSSFKTSRKELNSSNFIFKFFTLLIVLTLLGFGGWEAWKKFGAPKFSSQSNSNELPLNFEAQNTDSSDVASNIIALDPQTSDSTAANTEHSQESNADSNTLSNEPETVLSEIEQSLTDVAPNGETIGVTLKANFTFTDKCWVKVVDASGEVLAVGEKAAGKIMPLEGVAPLSVILGNPSAVKLTVDGETYDLSVFRPGQRAKFELTSNKS